MHVQQVLTTDRDTFSEELTRLTPMAEWSKALDFKLWSSHACVGSSPTPDSVILNKTLFLFPKEVVA